MKRYQGFKRQIMAPPFFITLVFDWCSLFVVIVLCGFRMARHSQHSHRLTRSWSKLQHGYISESLYAMHVVIVEVPTPSWWKHANYHKYMSNGLNLLHLRKDVAEMVIVFLCVPHRSWGFEVRNKIRQTCVSKVIVFCVTPIVTVPKCRRFRSWRALIYTCIQYCNTTDDNNNNEHDDGRIASIHHSSVQTKNMMFPSVTW